jgi:5-methylcytosine-specific restriction endonuclease McrBC regulatory subunit McrC
MKKLSGSIAFIQLIYLCNFILEFQSPTNRKLEYKNWNLNNKNNMRDMYDCRVWNYERRRRWY